MIQKIKNQIITALALTALVAPFAYAGTSFAADPPPKPCNETSISNALTAGANSTTTGTSSNCVKGAQADESSITKIAKSIVNILSLIIGAIAVIMIIIGGFKYVTSSGDSNRVGSAKNTIIYALIGLVIVALAQIIVKFVLVQTDDAITPDTTGLLPILDVLWKI